MSSAVTKFKNEILPDELTCDVMPCALSVFEFIGGVEQDMFNKCDRIARQAFVAKLGAYQLVSETNEAAPFIEKLQEEINKGGESLVLTHLWEVCVNYDWIKGINRVPPGKPHDHHGFFFFAADPHRATAKIAKTSGSDGDDGHRKPLRVTPERSKNRNFAFQLDKIFGGDLGNKRTLAIYYLDVDSDCWDTCVKGGDPQVLAHFIENLLCSNFDKTVRDLRNGLTEEGETVCLEKLDEYFPRTTEKA